MRRIYQISADRTRLVYLRNGTPQAMYPSGAVEAQDCLALVEAETALLRAKIIALEAKLERYEAAINDAIELSAPDMPPFNYEAKVEAMYQAISQAKPTGAKDTEDDTPQV